MFTETFTVSGSSLSLLKPGEQGVVSRVGSADEATVEKLRAMGIVPGVTITLQQRSPAYTIVVGGDRSLLCQKTADAIYVRLTARSISAPIKAAGIIRLLTPLFQRLGITQKHPNARKNTRQIEFATRQNKSACVD